MIWIGGRKNIFNPINHPPNAGTARSAIKTITRLAQVRQIQAPIWRYCIALHKLHDSAAGAIGILIPQLGIIIVVSHLPNYQVGDILQQD